MAAMQRCGIWYVSRVTRAENMHQHSPAIAGWTIIFLSFSAKMKMHFVARTPHVVVAAAATVFDVDESKCNVFKRIARCQSAPFSQFVNIVYFVKCLCEWKSAFAVRRCVDRSRLGCGNNPVGRHSTVCVYCCRRGDACHYSVLRWLWLKLDAYSFSIANRPMLPYGSQSQSNWRNEHPFIHLNWFWSLELRMENCLCADCEDHSTAQSIIMICGCLSVGLWMVSVLATWN